MRPHHVTKPFAGIVHPAPSWWQLQPASFPRQEAFCLLATGHPSKKTGLQMA